MFKAYYEKGRFRHIHHELKKSGRISYRGQSHIRKTGCFYGKDFNFYIDTSDGVNSDLGIPEYCGRMMKVIDDSKGKPFFYFKTSYSPAWTRNIVDLAAQNGGKVIPFLSWCWYHDYYQYVIPRRRWLIRQNKKTKKNYDIGMGASLKPYPYPKPNAANPLISWQDYNNFGLGKPDDTGQYMINTRQRLHDQLNSSNFSYIHTSNLSYKEYIKTSFQWKTVLSPAGIGDYTQRMFEHGILGQCIIATETKYDFGFNWREYVPVVDFSRDDWQEQLASIMDEYEVWADKLTYYLEKYRSPSFIVGLLWETMEKTPIHKKPSAEIAQHGL